MFSITLTRYQKCGLFGLLGIVLFVVSVAVALNSVLVGMLGGCFGSLCAITVISNLPRKNPLNYGPEDAMLFWRTFCDLGVGLRFAFGILFNYYQCGSAFCMLTDESGCAMPAAVIEFFVLASEAWILCLVLDLRKLVSDPFSSQKDRLLWYHVFCWSIPLLLSFSLYFEGNGVWYITKEVSGGAGNSFCWIRNHSETSSINYRPFVYFYTPLVIVYLVTANTLVQIYRKIRSGLSQSFTSRSRVFLTSSMNVLVYFVYYTFLLIAYAATNETAFTAPRASFFLYNLTVFAVACRGYASLVAFYLIDSRHDAGPKGNVVNLALKEELLFFATLGIAQSVTRSAGVGPGQQELVLELAERVDAPVAESGASHRIWGLLWAVLQGDGARLSEALYHKSSLKSMSSVESVSMNVSEVSQEGSSRHFFQPSTTNALHDEGVEIGVKALSSDGGSDNNGLSALADSDLEQSSSLRDFLCCGSTRQDPTFQGLTARFVEHTPALFRRIRVAAGVSDAAYMSAFEHTIKERVAEGGASGAFFFYSQGERFVAKSCTAEELNNLLGNASNYTEHVTNHPNCIINNVGQFAMDDVFFDFFPVLAVQVPIFGAYTLSIYEQQLSFLVLENILLTSEAVHEKYDIKGSWVNRLGKNPVPGQRVTCKYCNKSYVAPKSERRWSHNSSLDKTSSDSAEIESLVDMQAAMKCLHAELGTHRPDIVLKDNNLRSKIMLSEPECRAILTQLRKDANFLCDNGFMDYSLLIGVHHAHFDVNSDAAEPICKDRTSFGRTARKYQTTRVVGAQSYYFGIIDFQQRWTWEKWAERAVKTLILRQDPMGLSAIEPPLYRDRFISAMEELFEEVNIEGTTSI